MASTDPTEPRAVLESVRDPDPVGPARRRAAWKSPALLRPAVESLLEPRLDPERRLGPHDLAVAIDRTPRRATGRFFRALHPALGDDLHATFDTLVQRPYTMGHLRRGFRAPHDPQVSATSRGQWLRVAVSTALPYPRDAAWFAAWAGHLGWNAPSLGQVFATAIDRGDTTVRDVLLATVANTHPTAVFGGHVPVGLLGATDPEGWDAIERLLLAARRQEGLRQSILEAVDLAHPTAFRRLLRVVLEHDLLRFAAAVRAVGVWFGEPFEVRDRRQVADNLEALVGLLEDPDGRDAALARPVEPMRTFLALWAEAHADVVAATLRASDLLAHRDADTRLAAARLLHATQLPMAHEVLVPALADDDLRVAAVAFDAIGSQHWLRRGREPDGLFDALWALQDRLDDPVELPVGLLRPHTLSLSARDVCDALPDALDGRPPASLAPVVARMSPDGRRAWTRHLAGDVAANRSHLLDLAKDRSSMVRDGVFRVLETAPPPSEDEARELEDLLRRKPSDLRRGVVLLLLRRDPAAVVESVDRLAAGTTGQQRGAVELLVEVQDADAAAGDRHASAIRASALRLVAELDLAEGDRDRLAPALGEERGLKRLDAVEDLVDQAGRTFALPPDGDLAVVAGWDDAVAGVVSSLDRWLVEHRDVEVTVTRWHGPDVRLLGDLVGVPQPSPNEPWEVQIARVPLPEIVEPWWDRTTADWSDSRLELHLARPVWELVTADAWADEHGLPSPPRWFRRLAAAWPRTSAALADTTFPELACDLLGWLALRELTPAAIDGVVALASGLLAAVPNEAVVRLPSVADLVNTPRTWRDRRSVERDFRALDGIRTAMSTAVLLEAVRPETWSTDQRSCLWTLLRFVDEPAGNHDPETPRVAKEHVHSHHRQDLPSRPARRFPPLGATVRAVDDGVATAADLADLVVAEETRADHRGPDRSPARPRHHHTWGTVGAAPLGELTRRRPTRVLLDHPWLVDVVDDLRDRILQVELARGDLPTAATHAARQLRTVVGADVVGRVLAALGRQHLVRGHTWDTSRPAVLSHLVRVAFPAPDDTPDTFAAAVRRHDLPVRRVRELAVYAPQWADLVEAHLDWPGLADAVWWLHAHTKDERWSVDADVRAEWAARSHEHTPLTSSDLVAGAVDVAWFERVRARLGDAHLDQLLGVAKYASSSGGHIRATLFANAIRGVLDEDEVLDRMDATRHQDSVRALGLLPLPDDPDQAAATTLARWQRLMAWQKEGRRFGQQRRASEAAAVEIALDNLARTAGHADPQRLRWAMEAESVADLSDGPVTTSVGDVTVALSISDDGAPQLGVDRAGRVLKHVPRDAAKDPGVVALKDRVRTLRDQATRMRASLEESCVRGDTFTPQELADLATHPLMAAQLATLVVVDRTGHTARPAEGGRRLVDLDDTMTDVGGVVRIAHPVDLLAEGRWHHWQRKLFDERVRQPFRQVFRELYLPVGTETGGATRSDRWAGHQVQSGQAAALFGRRGWVVHRDGGALRTWHRHGITSHVTALGLRGTPGEVEDTTIESVWFVSSDQDRPLAIDDVPPRLFSEVMRDLDLVVSVAHAGGVDPEATASTVEMRAMLVDETARMLGLDNVELTGNHVIVTGTRGTWSIHLGSAVVHRRPGNAVCIVPVGAQHRGRLFLPFVDDDPRTAEVLSKVVLLARDHQIQDPSILAQLGA